MNEAEQLAELAVLEGLVEEADAPGAEGGQETAADERLIAGKFQTYEALEHAYLELQQAFSRSNNERVALEQQLTAQAYAESYDPAGGPYDYQQAGVGFTPEADGVDPIERLTMLGQITAAAVRAEAGAPPPNPDAPFEHVVSSLAERFPDFVEYEERIMAALRENPAMLGPDPASTAKDPVQLQAALAAAYVSEKNADAQAGASRQMKMQAQTLSGTSGRPESLSDDAAYVERIFKANVSRYT